MSVDSKTLGVYGKVDEDSEAASDTAAEVYSAILTGSAMETEIEFETLTLRFEGLAFRILYGPTMTPKRAYTAT